MRSRIFLVLLIISALIKNSDSFAIDLEEKFDKGKVIKDTGSVAFDDSITSRTLIDQMGLGWNLGNTLDAFTGSDLNQGLGSETSWGVTKTTESIIKGLQTKGIKTIRVPVTWHNHLIDWNYTIDPNWMRRVKTIVDWCIKYGLYVIINIHHDNAEYKNINYGQGFYPSRVDMAESERYIYNIWKQIATAFNNGYDHHLIFEGLNEPRLRGNQYEWYFVKGQADCDEGASVLNEYMKLAVKAIRTSGGNNEKRFIMVTPLAASYHNQLSQVIEFPDDSAYNPTNPKILLSMHMYLPYNFALNGDTSYSYFTDEYANELYNDFKDLYESFVLKGHHVVIGEMGATNKNNDQQRINWGKYFISNARKFQLAPVLWDNQNFDNSQTCSEVFGFYKRNEGKWQPDNLINAYVEASKTPLEGVGEQTAQTQSLQPTEQTQSTQPTEQTQSTQPTEQTQNEATDEIVESPVEFKEWDINYEVKAEIFKNYNSNCKLVIKTKEPSFTPEYTLIMLYLGDWSTYIDLTESEIVGATLNGKGGFYFGTPNTIEITFSKSNIELIKKHGLFVLGNGYVLTSMVITGSKLTSFEPQSLQKNQEKYQQINLQFNEVPSKLNGYLKLVNNQSTVDLYCKYNANNNKILNCVGLFATAGSYKIADNQGVLLSPNSLNVN